MLSRRHYISACLVSALAGSPAVAQQPTRPQPRKVAPAKPVAKPIAKPVNNTLVRDQFANAMKLAQAGKADEAMMAFEQLLRQYPAHQPSLIQYAKLLYSRDRIPEAYQAFSRVNPIGLDPETSYEFALSHFWMRQYEPALYGFKRVPEGHALFDLANYYGSISALKLRRFIEAETMMEKAIVLPEQLAKSRRNYLKHIQDMMLLQEKQGLTEERDREKKRVEDAIKKEEPVKLSAAQANKYLHRGFQSIDVEADLGINYMRQVSDLHGYAERDATVRQTYFEFLGGVILPVPLKFGKNQAAFGLQLTGHGEEELRKGQEQRNVQDDDLEDVERIQNADPERTLTKFGSYAVEGWFEMPTPARIWLAVGGKIFQKFPDFEAENRSGIYQSYLQLGSKERGREYVIRYQYGEITNRESERTQTVHEFDLDWHLPIIRGLAVDVELNHKIFEYHDESIDGPSSASSLTPDLSYELPYGFTLGLVLGGTYQSDYLFHNVPNYPEVSADGETYSGKAYIKIEPFSWFNISVSQELRQTNWSVTPEEATEDFEQNNPDYEEEFQAKAMLNLLF